MGRRFRVDYPLPFDRRKRADVVFPSARVAVFVDGCFWHACPRHVTWPRANGEWWRSKLLANRTRDRRTSAQLRREGWTVVRIWEHETVDRALKRVCTVLAEAPTNHHSTLRSRMRTSVSRIEPT
jgi:DNA mismatch endonuclease (patch repair protein)